VSWPGFGPTEAPTPPEPSTTPPTPDEAPSPVETTPEENSTTPSDIAFREFSSDWYASLVRRECDGVQSAQAQDGLATLLRGLRAACPAVTPDGHAAWDVAEKAYDELSPSGGGADTDCEAGIGYELLRALVILHRTYPDAKFHVAMDESTAYGGC
jgi:hypothetical protein